MDGCYLDPVCAGHFTYVCKGGRPGGGPLEFDYWRPEQAAACLQAPILEDSDKPYSGRLKRHGNYTISLPHADLTFVDGTFADGAGDKLLIETK